ncbi:hypothetical protein OH76DRAFT_1002871 [Lentinus brumalis]|uniref:Uncharacterized protein n=1 Tax=Lentinus brumalis TaxID=2498619 RepID=A0A371DQN7_9APHY|nr:hypothetical protein OH76DRAFT_1002871 [Polyporus brumalis]
MYSYQPFLDLPKATPGRRRRRRVIVQLVQKESAGRDVIAHQRRRMQARRRVLHTCKENTPPLRLLARTRLSEVPGMR